MNGLPPEEHDPKASSDFVKFKDKAGNSINEIKLRILSKPVYGWEEWLDGKVTRTTHEKKPKKLNDPSQKIRYFWAFVVWNYTLGSIQVWHLTQATVRDSLRGLSKDSDWGPVHGYDVKIIKDGEGIETKYTVSPSNRKEIAQPIQEAFRERPCNLGAIFEGKYPFGEVDDTRLITPAAFGKEESFEDEEIPFAPKPTIQDLANKILKFLVIGKKEYVIPFLETFDKNLQEMGGSFTIEQCVSEWINNEAKFHKSYSKFLASQTA